MKFTLFAVAALMTAVLCGCSTSAEKTKTLVLYYSQTGATKVVAEELQRQLGAYIACIEVVEPYDEDYAATVARWRQECEAGVKVAIQPLVVNIDQYDTIFLGFPIWGGTVASPVATFLADNSLAGKTIVTFATFGSGGIDSATVDVAAAQPDATVVKGYGVRNARIEKAPAEIARFLIENGYVEGKIESLPEYGETTPVTEEDVAVFDAACGDYQFPLGTPVTVAKRSYDGTTDYRFDVQSQTPPRRHRDILDHLCRCPAGRHARVYAGGEIGQSVSYIAISPACRQDLFCFPDFDYLCAKPIDRWDIRLRYWV